MRKSKFSEHQIIKILKEVEAGRSLADVCRDHGVSPATYYNWKSKYGGMEASDIKRLKDLEKENAKLKKMFAELSLENEALNEARSVSMGVSLLKIDVDTPNNTPNNTPRYPRIFKDETR